MPKVVGYAESKFNAKDTGKEIKGVNIYLEYVSKNVTGIATDRLYVTENRLTECGYYPNVGDEVDVMYNKFGKVQYIGPAENA